MTMRSKRLRAIGPVCVLLLLLAPAAQAQFAVIDVRAVTQLVQQVQTLRQQLETARNQLTEARTTLESMRGARGMELLLAGTVRNYLPEDWAALEAAVRQASATHAGLGAQIRLILEANAVLSTAQLDALSPYEREQIEAARR